MSHSVLSCIALQLCLYLVQSSEPNPPEWPSSVYVFSPGDDETTQRTVDEIFAENGGTQPPDNGQWSDSRFALLFKPGTYNVSVNIGYYTSLSGLGTTPSQVRISDVMAENGAVDHTIGALNNFWRSAENFETKPSVSANGQANTMMWAVSQGVSMRRVVVKGNLDLFQADGYASGGYMSNMVISGDVRSGGQQQWLTRNANISGAWIGGNWNMMYLGVKGQLPSEVCANKTSLQTSIEATPIIAEKPFITVVNGLYYLSVPMVEEHKIGATDFDELAMKHVDFSRVYVARNETDTADTINAKIAQDYDVILTGGTYRLKSAIRVTVSSTVVLGIGYPTLMSVNGNAVIEVADHLEDVRIGGVLLQAGPEKTDALLKFGTTKGMGSGYNFLYDIWARIGGPNDPAQEQWTADIIVQVNSNNVVLDNTWLWRADHGVGGLVTNGENPCNIGLQINGDNVVGYSLKVEHTLQHLVEWNGNNGSAYFFQSEFPYDVDQQQYGDQDYNAWKVHETVTDFYGVGLGMYSYFRDYEVYVENAIAAPRGKGIVFENVCTVFLNGFGGIKHVMNGFGASVNTTWRDTPSTLCYVNDGSGSSSDSSTGTKWGHADTVGVFIFVGCVVLIGIVLAVFIGYRWLKKRFIKRQNESRLTMIN